MIACQHVFYVFELVDQLDSDVEAAKAIARREAESACSVKCEVVEKVLLLQIGINGRILFSANMFYMCF